MQAAASSIFFTVTVCTEDNGIEGALQVLVKRHVKADCLLGLRVRIDDGFLDPSRRACSERFDAAQGVDVSVGMCARDVSLADP